MSSSGRITQLVRSLSDTDPEVADNLYELIYQHLKLLARKRLAGEACGRTLQPTDLVNEAYLRIVQQTRTEWRDRRHFFGVAAEAMRRILVDSARRRKSAKRGGDWNRDELSETDAFVLPVSEEWLDLDDALHELRELAPDKAELVQLRFYSGLTLPECAELLGISLSTAERMWRFARAWLKTRLESPVDNASRTNPLS
jgi:RNA polymerase sigma factor (TIGR02999 family)